MLKIKDNVDLKELEKFGFKPKYNEDTGKICAYEKYHKEIDYIGLSIKIEKTRSRIRIFKRTNVKEPRWEINPYKELFDIDTLYNLIKADLVEKVEDR